MKLQFRSILLLVFMLVTVAITPVLRPTHHISDERAKVNLEQMIPGSFGDWHEDNSILPIQPPPDLQAVINKTYDQTLSKTYVNTSGTRIMLSIAYGGSQREEMSTHRPEVCYPAQGFELISARPDNLAILGRTLPLNRVVARQGARNEPITYWVVVGDELTSFGFRHKLSMLKYNLTGRIPDGMLIRISSIDRDESIAFKLQDQFILSMLSALSQADQTRLLGALSH